MDSNLNERIARVIARRVTEQAITDRAQDHPERAKQVAHDKVVGELPQLLVKISSAVSEVNDCISDVGLGIKLELADAGPVTEALYIFRVIGREKSGPALSLSVDYKGMVSGVISEGNKQKQLYSASLFEVNRGDLMNILVELLEAQYR